MANEQNDSRLFNSIHKLSKLMGKTPKVLEPILPVKEIQCAEDIVNAMTEVEIALHGVTDSKIIGEKVMKTICDFYQAQYVGIMELDIDMDAWFPGWCIDATGNSVDYLLTQSDYVLRVPTWYEAYRSNNVIVLENIPASRAPMMLVVNLADADQESRVLDITRKYSRFYKVRSRNLTGGGMDMIVEVKVKDESAFVKEVCALDTVQSASLIAHDGEVTF